MIGIVCGVFFFMLFVIVLVSYLHQKYLAEIQFDLLPEFEDGEGDCIAIPKSFSQYYYDKILDQIHDIWPTPTESAQQEAVKKKKKKKKKKTKVKRPLSDDGYIPDVETGSSSHGRLNNDLPSKTQYLYTGSTKKVSEYTSSASFVEPESNILHTIPGDCASSISDDNPIHNSIIKHSKSTSRGLARKHPCQL